MLEKTREEFLRENKELRQRLDEAEKIVRDITKQKQAEQRFRSIVEAAPDALIVVNPEGRIVIVNGRVKELLGYERDELLGRGLEILIPKRFRHVHLKHLLSFFKAPSTRPMGAGLELFALRKDGSEVPVDISLSPLASEEGILTVSAVRDVTQRKQAEEEIRRLSGRLLQAQEDERRRIAHELHDSTAQALAAITINLGVVEGSLKTDDEARNCLQIAIGLARECTDEVRSISTLLRPPLLDLLGLAPALARHVTEFQSRTKISVDLKVSPKLARLPKETETALFRIVQEGLTNVFRHSGSARAKVELLQNPAGIVLEIIDEGSGMGSSAIERRIGAHPGPGLGLSGMRERVRHIGGNFRIISSEKGTTICVALPLPRERRGEKGGERRVSGTWTCPHF